LQRQSQQSFSEPTPINPHQDRHPRQSCTLRFYADKLSVIPSLDSPPRLVAASVVSGRDLEDPDPGGPSGTRPVPRPNSYPNPESDGTELPLPDCFIKVSAASPATIVVFVALLLL